MYKQRKKEDEARLKSLIPISEPSE